MYKFDLLKFARMTNFWYPRMIHFGSFFYWFVKYLCSVPMWLWFCPSRPLVLSYFNFTDFKAIPLAVCICRIYFTSELNSLWGCSILDSSLLLTRGPSKIPTWILTWFRGFSLLYGAWVPTFVSTDTRGCQNLYSTFFSAFPLFFRWKAASNFSSMWSSFILWLFLLISSLTAYLSVASQFFLHIILFPPW